jgi:site-specific DNA-methyltransferase (adenine-specific)
VVIIIKLLQGDCLELMKDIPDKSVDMVLCDLPYGTTACKWDSAIPFEFLWEQYNRIVKKHGVVALFGTQPFTSKLIMSNLKHFKYEIIWHKSKSGSAFTAKYRPIAKHENICIFCKGTAKYNPQLVKGEPYSRIHKKSEAKINNHNIGFKHSDNEEVVSVNTGFRYPETVQFFQQKWRRQDQLHPTQKPVDLLEWLIKSYTIEHDVVLDNCMGSGSTGIACLNTNRDFVGMELNEEYFSVAKTRIEEHMLRLSNKTAV